VPLLQGFLHGLHMLAGVGEEPLALSQVGAQHTHLIVWTQGACQQAIGMEPLEPLAVAGIPCGPAGGPLCLAGIDQERLEPTGLQHCNEGNPIDARRFHGHRRDVAGQQPGRKRLESEGTRPKAADRLGIAVGGHSPPMLGRRQIDGGGVRIAPLQ
jgi:hypothetical protein